MPSCRTILVALAGFAALCGLVAAADGEESGPEIARRMREFFFEISPAKRKSVLPLTIRESSALLQIGRSTVTYPLSPPLLMEPQVST